MSLLVSGGNYGDGLPSISRLATEKLNIHGSGDSKILNLPGANVVSGLLANPSATHSGPPPPYSTGEIVTEPIYNTSGYISPPESTTRRSTRDEKESIPIVGQSLPSLFEALGDRSMLHGPIPPSQNHASGCLPSSSSSQYFPDRPYGPPNPFSQPPPAPSSTMLLDLSTSNTNPVMPAAAPTSARPDPVNKSTHDTTYHFDPSPVASRPHAQPVSPRESVSLAPKDDLAQFRSANSFTETQTERSATSVYPPHRPHAPYESTEYNHAAAPQHTAPTSRFVTASSGKFDGPASPFARGGESGPYGETIKRHLDIFDAEGALGEISNASNQTLSFSRNWGQRYHQANRSNVFSSGVPELAEIDEMLRQSQRVTENLSKIRHIVVMHQTALSEERARLSRPSLHDDIYRQMHTDARDEYRPSVSGGFAGGDAKKRRGKAAPPGRCHSCNRAETPEWRRGPDGARTLCNACGLHYAKLTRKMSQQKPSGTIGPHLRPKHDAQDVPG